MGHKNLVSKAILIFLDYIMLPFKVTIPVKYLIIERTSARFSKLFMFIFLFLSGLNLYSQSYKINDYNGLTVNTCSGIFYDSGGNANPYNDNENFIATFCSNNGSSIMFDFSSFDVRFADTLYVYDGTNTSSPLIGKYSGILPPFKLTSSGTCLTFNFKSDGSFVRNGWAATISCCPPPITSPIIPSATEVCAGTTVNYSVTNHVGSTYNWSVVNGTPAIITGGANNQDITWDLIGNVSGIIKIVEVNNCGSKDSSELIVDIYDLPAVDFSGLNSDYCLDAAAVILTGNPAGGVFTGSGISGNTFTPSVAGVGTHNITYTYIDPVTTCSNQKTIQTTVSMPAVFNVGASSNTYCTGSDVSITLSGSEAGVNYQMKHDGVDEDPPLPGTGSSLTWSNKTNGVYTVVATNATSLCTINMSGSQTITVNPLPTPSITGSNDVCPNAIGTSYSTANVPGNSYNWSVIGGAINGSAVGNSILVDWGPAGPGTVKVTETITATVCSVTTPDYIVLISDAVAPTALCKNITVYLDAFGNATITGNNVDNGSTDNCGIASLSVAPDTFNNSNIGANTVTLTVTDNNGNISTCTSVVTVMNNAAPIAICKNINVQLNGAGTVTITGADVDNGSNDPDGIASLSVAPNTFSCLNIGPNNVTLTVTDNAGISSICFSVVTVQDNVPPVISCPGNVNVFTDAGICGAVVSYLTPVGTDNCSGSVTTQTAGFGSGSTFPVGTTTNTFLVTDGAGLTSTCSFTITVTDNEDPVIILPAPPVINANAGCLAPIPSISAIFSDNCTALGSLVISQVPAAGTMVSPGATTVTITATDQTGNSSSANINVSVVDATKPVITTPANITLNLDNNCQALVPDFLTSLVVSDNCTATGSITKTQTPAAGSVINGVAATNILIEATDESGNKQSSTVMFITQDVTPPVVLCKNINLYVDGSGSAALIPSAIDNGSTDNCSAVLNLSLSKTAFNCSDIGAAVSVILTGKDASLNSATCTSFVTVLDTIKPVVNVKTFNLVLGPTGTGTLLPANVNNGSFDNCGTITLSVAPNTFNCGDQGLKTVTLTALDSYGNSKSKSVQITVSSSLSIDAMSLSTCDVVAPYALFSSIVTGGSGTYTYFWDGLENAVDPFVSFDGISPFIHFSNTSTVANPFFNNLMPDGIYNILLVVTDGNGCRDTSGMVLNKDGGLIFNNVTLKSSNACIGETKTYSVAAGATEYAWNVMNGTILTATNTNTVDVLWGGISPGKLVVLITKNDLFGNSCSASVEETVTINAIPSPAFNSPAISVCENSEYTYTLTNTYTSYSWIVTNGAITGGGSPGDNFVKVRWGAFAAGNVTVNVTNGSGCTNIASTAVTINAVPIPTLSSSDADNIFCAGTSVTFTASGGTTYDFRINGTSVQNSGSAIYTTPTILNGQTVDVIVTSVSGCSTTSGGITNTVIAYPTPTLSSSDADNSFCAGTSVMFTAGGGTNFNFRVNGTSVQNSGAATYTTAALTNGQVVDVIVTNAGGCSTTSVGIANTVIALPTPTLISSDIDNTFCAGTSVIFTAGGGTNYNFRVDGVSVQNGLSTTYTTTALTSGQVIDVIVSNASGCTATSAGITNIVNPLPTATLSSSDADNTICSGTNVTFTSTGGTNYNFRVNGTSVQNSISSTYTTTTLTTGQIVDVIVTNAGSCTATSAGITTTVTTLPAATISYAGSPFCRTLGAGQTVTLTGTPGGIYTAAPAGLTIDAVTGAINPGTSTAGLYTVTYTIAAAGGCGVVTATTPVTITALPVATFSYPGTPYCSSGVDPLPAFSGGGVAGVFSSTGGLVFISTASGQIDLSASTAGTYTVSNTIASAGGCGVVTATTSVTITASQVATFSYAGTPYCNSSANPSPTFSGGGVAGTFSSTAGLVFLSAATGQVNLSLSTPGTYTVTNTIAASGGCAVVTATNPITITTVPTANISYAGTPFCKSLATAQPVTLNGTGAFSGGTYSSTAGLTINPANGDIIPGTSTAGTYTVTYIIPASGGCASVPVTTSVTITTLPTATIGYAGTPFCTSVATAQPVTLTGTAGGTFTAGAGLSINAVTGAITPATSISGTYTVIYTIAASGGCGVVTATSSVTITTAPAATISYAGTPFCTSVATAQPVTLTGTAGGTYAAPAGLSINAATGSITPGASIAGTYTVTYTIAATGGCSVVSATTSVTIKSSPVAAFSYTGMPYCNSSANPSPTFSGGGVAGTFSSTAGLVFVSIATGQVNLSLSTPGSYTVTNTIAASGGCAVVTATNPITITTVPTANISYAGTPFCKSLATAQPVTLNGTGAFSGGTYSSTPGLTINPANGDIIPGTSTAGTYTVTYIIPASGGCASVPVTTSVTITTLPTATISYAGAPYCNTLATQQSVTFFGTLGGTYSAAPAGLSLNPVTGDITPNTSTPATYTITYTIPAAGGCSIVTATTNVKITALPTATISYIGSPFCKSVVTSQSVTLNGTGAYTGGAYSSTPGLTINPATGDITPATSTAGTYTVTYTVPASGGCVSVLATTSIAITAVPTATISYAGSPFCISVVAPQSVTLSGTGAYTGGTYGSTAGLNINPITGDITPNTSTAGTYTVTYTVPAASGCGVVTATTSVTITAIPVATFSYAGTPYCRNAANPSPTFSGGGVAGVFSSTGGLVFVSTATGQVNLASSTPGTYTVTNTLAASGGCGILTATSTITITAIPTATISYAGNPFCKSLAAAQSVTLNGTGAYAGGTYSSTVGLTINPANGDITPGTSTAGTYTVTYIVPASGGCASVPVTTSVTITTLPTATISYALTPYCSTVGAGQVVTLTGTSGGTYSSAPAGLNIDAVTGSINPSISTAGSYTVTYSIAAAGGCGVVIATAPVAITALPVASFSYSGTPYCSSGVDPLPTYSGGGVAGAFSSTAGLVFISTATGQVDLSASTPGTYTVTNTISGAGGCGVVTATTLVTITALPVAIFSYSGSPYCSDAIDPLPTYSGGGVAGTFSSNIGLVFISTVTGQVDLSASMAGTYTVTNTIAAAGGCVIVASTSTITITTLLTAAISYNGSPWCSSAPVQSVTLAGTSGGTYTAPAGLTINSGTGAITLGTSIAGTYIVTYTIAATGGCGVVAATASVTVNPTPTVIITNPAAVCSPSMADLTAAAVTAGSAAGLTFTYWTDALATSLYATPVAATTDIYYIKGTDASGCYDIKPVTVTVNPIPTVTITNPAAGCSPSTVDLTAASVTAGSTAGITITYWADAAATTGYATPATAGAGTYYIKGTDPVTSCYDIKPVTVTINPVPAITITNPAPVCSPSTVDLTAASVTAGSPAGLTFTYWTDALAIVPYGTPSTATTGTYYIKGMDGIGCYDIKPVTASVNPTPTSSVLVINVSCFGAATGAIDLTVSGGTPGYTYLWNNGTATEDISNVPAGAYNVTVSDANGCITTSNATITQPATAVSGSVSSLTNVSAYSGNDGSVTVVGSGGISPYQYRIGSGLYQASGTFGTLTAGFYTVTVQDINLCTFGVPVTITQPAPPVSGNITSQTNVTCFGALTGSVTLAGSGGVPPYDYKLDAGAFQSSGTFGALAAGTYTITVRDAALNAFPVSVTVTQPSSAVGGFISAQTNILCFGSNTGSVTISGMGGISPYLYKMGAGSYQVSGTFGTLTAGSYTLTVQDANLCTFFVDITIMQPLVAFTGSITVQTNVSCFGSANGSVTISGAGGTSPYEYSLNGGAYQASGIFSGLAAATYSLTVRDANQCTTNVPVTIAQPEAVAIAATLEDASCPGVNDGKITLIITGGIQPHNVIWSDGILTANRLNVSNGTYSVVVTDLNGCAASLDVVVGFIGTSDCLVIPQVITPNNDGYNDTWKIKNIDLFPNAEVFVFTRWGKLVFNTKNIAANEWDGTFNGTPLPTDSYHYVLHLNDGSEPRSGVISIIR